MSFAIHHARPMAKTKFAFNGMEPIVWLNIVALAPNLYYCGVENTSDILNKSVEWTISGAAKTASISASHTVVATDLCSESVAGQELPSKPLNAPCLWCDRTFTPRTTGGSAQKFCCTGHRQQFWIAARRWTMRAIDAGLLSVDCLKASQTSVHAA
jgi:hypothetical protein